MDAEAGKLDYQNGSESGGEFLPALFFVSSGPAAKDAISGREKFVNENKTTPGSSDIQPKGNASLANA
jgi:hypothetical protein